MGGGCLVPGQLGVIEGEQTHTHTPLVKFFTLSPVGFPGLTQGWFAVCPLFPLNLSVPGALVLTTCAARHPIGALPFILEFPQFLQLLCLLTHFTDALM